MVLSLGDYTVSQSDLACARNPQCDIQPVLDKMAQGGNTLASLLSLDMDNANVVPDFVKDPAAWDGTFDWSKLLLPIGLVAVGLVVLNRVIK